MLKVLPESSESGKELFAEQFYVQVLEHFLGAPQTD